MAVPALPRNSSACCWRVAAADAVDHGPGAFELDAAAQLAQRLQHDARVVGVQQVVHLGAAFAQRGQQQHAVGDAFGAGQAHRGR
jgi:hypothetical protein